MPQKQYLLLQIATLCLRLQCLALPIHAWVVVVNMLCVSLGEAKGALLLSTARQGTCFIPLAVQVHKKIKTAEKQTSPEPASLPRS